LKNCSALLALLALLAFALVPLCVRADQIAILGSADTFAVLGATTVTSAGSTSIVGDLGLYPGISITGFPPGTVSGLIHNGDAAAIAAQAAALVGYNYLAALPFTQNLSGQDLGSRTLTPGVYFFTTSAQLTGPLTLDFQGLNNADIVFQIGTTLTTAVGSSVTVLHQGTDDNVYYQVGTSATLGANSIVQGDILAHTTITLADGAGLSCGSLLAISGAVTLDNNLVRNCSSTGSDIIQFGPSPNPVPEPGTFGLLLTALLAGALPMRGPLQQTAQRPA
jgi:hypothetical protein